MNVTVVLAAIASQCFLAFGQIALKRLAEVVSRIVNEGLTIQGVADATIPLSITIILYAVTFSLWLYVLNSIPLNKAFLFVALSFVVVPFLSYFMLGETIDRGTIGATVLIISGIVVGSVWR